MSDGETDSYRDAAISKEEEMLIEQEKNYFTPGRKDFDRETILGLMQAWAEYAKMPWGCARPSKELAKRHIWRLGRLLDGQMSYQEIVNRIQEDNDFSRKYGGFAVGRHGGLTNSLDGIVRQALGQKYGEGKTPHSFYAHAENGAIHFERMTCRECPIVLGCTKTKECNCFNRGEHKKASEDYEERMKQFGEIAKKYGISLEKR